MYQKSFPLCLLTLIALISLTNADPEFCWRDSLTRGVGNIPNQCAEDEEKIGLFCYARCPPGFQRFGFDCHQTCKSGWTDQGLFCRLCEYGRGAGYPWQASDGLNNKGMLRRCRADNPGNDCEMSGAVAYPKCRAGFSPAGCCICRPSVPNCNAEGYNGGIDLSCAKKIIVGTPRQANCRTHQQKDGLLCYPKCPAGFSGVGPVCWGSAPQGWVQCGMGAADSKQTCIKKIYEQVTAVGKVIIQISTLGTANSAYIAVNQASKLPQISAKLMPLLKQIKQIYDQQGTFKNFLIEALKVAAQNTNAANIIRRLQGDISNMTPAEIVTLGAEIASLFDETGLANLIKAFSYDICSRIKPSMIAEQK